MRIPSVLSVFVALLFHSAKVSAAADCKITVNPTYVYPVCTSSNGSISVTPANGTAPYRYSWNNGDTTASAGSLSSGSYTVSVTDRNGCTATHTFTLTSTTRAIATSASAVSDTCAMARGKAVVTVAGSGSAPYKYIWSNSGTTATITGLSAHYYTVTITDANGCSATAGTSVSNIGTAISINGTLTQPLCYNSTGAINIHISGGTSSAYNVLWSNGSSASALSALQPGNYQVTVTGANACRATQIFALIRPDSINLQFKLSPVKCDSAMGGAITQTLISGANYPWTASWTGPQGFSSNSVSINRLVAGQYNLHFTDAHGCTTAGNYRIDSSGAVNVNYNVSSSYCGIGNGSITYQSLTPYSSTATYNWSGNNGFSANTKSISGLSAGKYYLTVAENFGCQAKSNFTVNNTFDVGVANIKYINIPSPAIPVTIHPIAGDLSQLNGLYCAAGISGQVQLVYSGQMRYQGVTQGGMVPTSIHGDTLIWNIADFGTLRIDSSFFVVLMTDSDAGPGNQVCITVSVTPVNGDNNPYNNTADLCLSTVRSYDPNEKQVFPEGDLDVSQKMLTYTIVFQNTGTGPAENVYILDTLDMHLDPVTLRVIASSHPVQSTLLGNAVKFNFPGISLPDSSVGLMASRGWVQYTAAIRDNVPLGAEITNTAYIYFDLNNPVTTNTTVNHFGINSATALNNVAADAITLRLMPNPAHNAVQIKTGRDAVGGKLEITDAMGKKCVRTSISNTDFILPLTDLSGGMYLVTVTKPSGRTSTAELIVE